MLLSSSYILLSYLHLHIRFYTVLRISLKPRSPSSPQLSPEICLLFPIAATPPPPSPFTPSPHPFIATKDIQRPPPSQNQSFS